MLMDLSVRRLLIAVLAFLAFFPGNLAMANGHGAAMAGHYDESMACEAGQSANVDIADNDTGCVSVSKATRGPRVAAVSATP